MPRRVKLPGASELFRPTQEEGHQARRASGAEEEPAPQEGGSPRGSGRVRHDEKITVYVSADELLALERARLTLRAHYGMAVDRGRIVREAVASALADLETAGTDSELIRRLSQP